MDLELLPAEQDTHRSKVSEPGANPKRTEYLLRSRRAFEATLRAKKVMVQPIDQQIGRRLRAFSLSDGDPVIVRYAWLEENLIAYIFRRGAMHVAQLQTPSGERNILQRLSRLSDWRPGMIAGRKVVPPTPELAKQIYDTFFAPVFQKIDYAPASDSKSRLYVIPSGNLFSIPLQAAWDGDAELPLCATVPMAFCFSGSALVSRGRFANGTIRVEQEDDLCVLGCNVTGDATSEAARIYWNSDRYYFAGDEKTYEHVAASVQKLTPPPGSPKWLSQTTWARRLGDGDSESLRLIQDKGPEFFLFHGHGELDDHERSAGPVLCLEKDHYASQYDLASHRWLTDNKLSILAACVTGQDLVSAGGEVSGLLRALAAAGGSATAVCLWEVLNTPTKWFIVRLFRELLKRAERCGLPETYRDVFRATIDEYLKVQSDATCRKQAALECCMFTLYL